MKVASSPTSQIKTNNGLDSVYIPMPQPISQTVNDSARRRPMNDSVREKLQEIISQYGHSLCDEPQRCESFLRDFCGKDRREIFILIAALREGVATDLLNSSNGISQQLVSARLVKRLQDNLGIAEEFAIWAVDSWALALGISSQSNPNHNKQQPETKKHDTQTATAAKYICLGQSVRGDSHKRNNLPKQDAIQWFPDYPDVAEGLPIILAVSDGHGSAKSFRSDIGSEKAVKIAVEVIKEEILAIKEEATKAKIENYLNLKDQVKYKLQQRIVREICRQWQTEVKENWEEHSATEELTNLQQQEGITARKQVEDNPLIAYGATLLCVIVTELFITYLQLGDGDILCVDTEGETTRPIPQTDIFYYPEVSAGLCFKDAWKEFRCKTDIFYPEVSADKKPALILVSTDGLSNSYSSDEDFLKIGQGYLEIIRSNGVESVTEELEIFLNDISTQGSGDDITLGMIVRQEASEKEEAENEKKHLSSLVIDFSQFIPIPNVDGATVTDGDDVW